MFNALWHLDRDALLATGGLTYGHGFFCPMEYIVQADVQRVVEICASNRLRGTSAAAAAIGSCSHATLKEVLKG